MPDLGEGLEDVTVVEWFVGVGDSVELNQPLCSVETAKSTVELPSPFAGVVLVCAGKAGERLRVGDLLARVDVNAADAVASEPRPGPVSYKEPTMVGYGVQPEAPTAAPRRWPPRDSGARTQQVGAQRSGGPPRKRPARHIATDRGMEAVTDSLPGSSKDMRHTDSVATRASAPERRGHDHTDDVREIPIEGVRARIAEHMVLARSTIPEATCAIWADCERLIKLRKVLTSAYLPTGGGQLTPFVIIAWLVLRALPVAPVLNSTIDGKRRVIQVHSNIHLGIAVDTHVGLVVPVIPNADTFTLAGFAAALTQLADSARTSSVPPADLTGSTFTISNYGALGLDDGLPVINYPETAILAVGSIKPRPAVSARRLTTRRSAKLTCSFDHRACDGADAARFLVRLKELIERPELAMLEI